MSLLARSAEDPADNRAYLLNNGTAGRYHSAVTESVTRISAKIAGTTRPFTGITVDGLTPTVSGVDLDAPLHDAAAALDELEEVYLRDAVYFHHPRYLAHLNCPVVIPALVGEAVLSAVNSSLDTWDQSAGGTLIERRLIDWTAERIGLGEAADGIFTSGGSQSNLQAMLLARDEACRRELTRKGATDARLTDVLPRLRILTSECGHFSIRKSATLLGMGAEAVIAVPSDENKRMRTDELAAQLARCERDGLIPMAVVATAGTTDFGSIDPLPEIAGLCAGYGAWMHVDAAYGCGLLVSRRRDLLSGIERADSVTVDYHKSFFQPVSSSAILVRDRATLKHVTYHADYLNPRRMVEQRIPNQVDKSIQTTRRFDALKLWLTLRIMGAQAVGELFDEVIDRAADAWKLLHDDPRFDVVVEPRLSTLVFRYVPTTDQDPELSDRVNLHAREALFASGEAIVASTVVDGRHYLKFTLLNPETTLEDIATVLDLIAEHAGSFLAEQPRPALSAR
ncbi:L-2,4-diaminobutyrate decarboxylase [Streptomyces sp. SceaMP-e96]|uniref:pyridoxal phosphate-dependent decarboxylase family protein n=1 Tax=unclassified Streptomyces TaxID=2593676 RepID=UPI000823CA60|nr:MULTISPECIES: aspartate aminotransferase family protein [unclassified Streptomyces]MYT18507.1 aminotransferase class V-fold PLP-dependent enzyme [Streptomyces sp. SID4951]SCK57146.1 L-2,4-diaminobutyrate decarboxylase [Streptomyces sp. SceaMP-e96]